MISSQSRLKFPLTRDEKLYIAWKLFSLAYPEEYHRAYEGMMSRLRRRFPWDHGLKLASYAEWLRYERHD